MNNNGNFKIDLLEQDILKLESDNSTNQNNIDKKKIILMVIPIILVILLVVIIKVKYSFFNNIKKKVVASQYKCEANYKLKNKHCILNKEQTPVLLGNVNHDQKVDQTDVDTLKLMVNSYAFDDLSYVASDINRDGNVDANDLKLLEDYVKNNINEYDIGIQKVCPMDHDNTLYYLNKSKDKCLQVIVKDASKKDDQESQLEEFRNKTNNIYNTIGSTSTVETYNTTDIGQAYDTSSAYTTVQYPSTNDYDYPNYEESIEPGYNTSYNTSNYIDRTLPEEELAIEDKNKSRLFYSKDSLVSIKEIKVPSSNIKYNLKDNLELELDIEQKGTGFYYYDIQTYYGSNAYNNGYLNTVSSCQRLKTNSIKKLDLAAVADGNRLIFNIYTEKDCRIQTLKAKYISSIYRIQNDLKISKLVENSYNINKGLKVFVLKPMNGLSDYNYRIRYSISDGKNYFVKENNNCLPVVNGMNQLKNSINNKLDIYSDNKCSKIVKKISLK